MKRKMLYQLMILLSLLLLWSYQALAKEKICFLHIPKTGGVTVSSLLMDAYHYDTISNTEFKKIELFSYEFHLSLFEIKQILNVPDFKLITFLRHPVDRVLSEYFYTSRKFKGSQEVLAAHKIPVDGNPIETISNCACKMLSGLDDKDGSISIETHLVYAKKALQDQFFFIGITEQMNRSIQLLFSHLNYKIPEKIPHFNRTDRDIVFSEEVLQEIAERNWADIELYYHALTLFDRRSQEIKLCDPSNPEKIEFYNEYHYDFNQTLEGYGWGLREKDECTKTIYRWASEDNEAEIDFYLQPDQDYLLKAIVLLQPVFCQQLLIFVNSIPIPVKFHNSAQKGNICHWFEYQGFISRNYIKKGEKTRIRFKMIPPQDPFLNEIYQKGIPHPLQNYTRGKFACKNIDLSSITGAP